MWYTRLLMGRCSAVIIRFEDLYGDGSVADASYPVVYQTDMEHPLWDVDSDSDYYVSYISDYHSLDGWGITDTAFAREIGRAHV